MEHPGMRQQGMCARFALAAVSFLILAGLVSRTGAQEILPPPMNPLQAATLHWYAANQTTQFTLGGYPAGVVFDGESIWIGNFNNTVTKLRPSDGTVLASYPVPDPYVLAYDGANLWATDCNGQAVTKIRASDGTILGHFPVGSCSTALVFDGANIWVGAHNIVKLRASDGANLGSFDIGNTAQNLSQGIAFDGTNIWAANSGTNSAPGHTVTKLRASDGAILAVFTVGSAPEAMTFDGSSIWVSNNNSGTVSQLRASDGETLGTFTVGTLPNGIGFDGANVWVANSGSNSVTRIRVSLLGTGPRLQTFPVGNAPVNGVAFDGANVWVTNLGSGTVSKL